MSVVSVNEHPGSPYATFEWGKHKITRMFTVVTSDKNSDGPVTVVDAPGIPRFREFYLFANNEFHLQCKVKDINPKRVEDGSPVWEVEVVYETPEVMDYRSGGANVAQTRKQGEENNPLIKIPEVTWSIEEIQVPIFAIFDSDNKLTPCKNTAGEIYDPPPMKTESRHHLQIVRNEDITANHPALGVQYGQNGGAVNKDKFWGAAPGVVKCRGIFAERQQMQLPNGTPFAYLRVTYKFSFRAEGWILAILDSGSYHLKTVKGEQKKIPFMANGHPIQGLLNGKDGHKLDDGEKPLYNLYKIYPSMNFAPLGLPQGFADLH